MKGRHVVTKDRPIYNIGIVARITGIPTSTLRVWERRYNYPKPARSEGRQRLYTESQVAGLKWVKSQIGQGMRVGQVIHVLQQGALEGFTSRGELGGEAAFSGERRTSMQGADLNTLQKRLLADLMSHDLARANQVLYRDLSQYSVETQIMKVIIPTLQEIGDAWASGRATVSTEHLATQFLRLHLGAWSLTAPPPYSVPPTVLACAPEEAHEGGLLILGTLLQRRRWPVAYLGQSVPLGDLAQFVQEVQPLAVVLAAAREETAETLVHWPQALCGVVREGRPTVCFGGRVFVERPEWRERVPGTYLGDDLESGVEILEGLLRAAAQLQVAE